MHPGVILHAVLVQLSLGQSPESVMELHHKRKKGGSQKEQTTLRDMQKFFPKVAGTGQGDSVNGFTDNLAESLDDAQAELLVAGQKPVDVCKRDIETFCGEGAMRSAHPLHCLGLLDIEKQNMIHKVCKVHIENSLTFTCAKDMSDFQCDPVIQSTIDCLSEDLDKVRDDCADMIRLVRHTIANVNNADVHVTDKSRSRKYKITNGRDASWTCPAGFQGSSIQAGCCAFKGGSHCDADSKRGGKYHCVKDSCKQASGRWLLKDAAADAPFAGHLCCAPADSSSPESSGLDNGAFLDRGSEETAPAEATEDEDERDKASSSDESGIPSVFWLVVAGAVGFWQRELVGKLLEAAKRTMSGAMDDASMVDVPGVKSV